jgi:leucyl/phenylalanyl-tRNA--protein transferase
MFHRETNASKVALVAAVRSLFAAGIELFDVQFLTSHLASMGVYEIPRSEYLSRVRAATSRAVALRDVPVRLNAE